MGDQPATKKELAALQKQVDEVRRWFQDEKKAVHAELELLTPKKWFDDEKKEVHGQLDEHDKTFKDVYADIDERDKWFNDEKKVVHDELDALTNSLKELTTQFQDEKKAVHAEIDGLKKWVEGELKKLQK